MDSDPVLPSDDQWTERDDEMVRADYASFEMGVYRLRHLTRIAIEESISRIPFGPVRVGPVRDWCRRHFLG